MHGELLITGNSNELALGGIKLRSFSGHLGHGLKPRPFHATSNRTLPRFRPP
jgi:hypothetical protein